MTNLNLSLKWIWITALIIFILGGVIAISAYRALFPCPEVVLTDIEVPIVADSVVIDTSGTVPATLVEKKDDTGIVSKVVAKIVPKKDPGPLSVSSKVYEAYVDLKGDEYFGELYMNIEIPGEFFSWKIDLTVVPDTVYVPVSVDVPVQTTEVPAKVKWFYLYLGGALNFGYDKSTGFGIEGGGVDVGFAVKKCFIVTIGPDTNKNLWLRTGILFR